MNTASLHGIALDWAVAKCEGVNDETFRLYYNPTEPTDYDRHGFPEFHYSTLWHKAGPIIEREGIRISDEPFRDGDCCHIADGIGQWYAAHRSWSHTNAPGQTPLIAAMRCYVASKLGDEVEVPDELFATEEG